MSNLVTHLSVGSEPTLIFRDALLAPFPPTEFAVIFDWNGDDQRGSVEQAEIEINANMPVNLTQAELMGASRQLGALADDNVDVVDTVNDELDIAGHAYRDGDGPVRFTTTGMLPGGLSLLTDYWLVVVNAGSVAVAETFEDAINDVRVDLTSAGSGVHTISDTPETKRVHWDGYGLLGYSGDGSISLDGERAYRARFQHSPEVFAYALVAMMSASDPEALTSSVNPVVSVER